MGIILHTMIQILQQYCAYNLWANKLFAEQLKNIDKELLDKTLVSSFDTLRKTVKHIQDAEVLWLNRLEGNADLSWPPLENIDGELIYSFYSSSEKFLEFMMMKDDMYSKSDCVYTTLSKKTFTVPVSGIVMHSMNHSTYHRGQLVTMMRNLGVTTIPSSDFFAFLRTTKGK